MIYNEGFEFRFNDKKDNFERYIAFSKYGKNEGNKFGTPWVSYCYETLVGWYNLGNEWGCFYGKKNVPDADVPTNGDLDDKQFITAEYANISENNSKSNNQKDSFLALSRLSRFFEKNNSGKFAVHANFKHHSLLVNKLNSANLSWKANNYEEFTGLTTGEIKKMAGTLRISKKSERRKKKKNKISKSFNAHISNLKEIFKCPEMNNKAENLPENFDTWEDFMGDAPNQVFNIF
jgi:hypothetical protein